MVVIKVMFHQGDSAAIYLYFPPRVFGTSHNIGAIMIGKGVIDEYVPFSVPTNYDNAPVDSFGIMTSHFSYSTGKPYKDNTITVDDLSFSQFPLASKKCKW